LWLCDAQGYETTMQLEIVDDAVKAIFIVRNPDKLAHLGLQA
jgi:hypothetical protein